LFQNSEFLVKTETIHPRAARIQAHENGGVISWEIPFGIFNLPACNDRWHMDYSYSTAFGICMPVCLRCHRLISGWHETDMMMRVTAYKSKVLHAALSD